MTKHSYIAISSFTFLIAFLSTPAALAQQPSPSTAPIPDFSGKWSHPYFPAFEPPLSGPGPVVNKSRARQVFDYDRRRLPPQTNLDIGNPTQIVGDYTNPILRPEAAEVVRKHGEISLTGVAFPTPSNQCWPGGVPYIFRNFGMEMLQQPNKVTILYSSYEFRQIRMNQPHPARVTSSWYGDSVGYYEGDTLVVDTVGIKVGKFAMVDEYGTPHTEALHVVERYRLLEQEAAKEYWERNAKTNFRIPGNDIGPEVDSSYTGKVLQVQLTIEDDGVFTTPWSATITYWRGLDERQEYVCPENLHEYYAGKDSEVPTADNPDF